MRLVETCPFMTKSLNIKHVIIQCPPIIHFFFTGLALLDWMQALKLADLSIYKSCTAVLQILTSACHKM